LPNHIISNSIYIFLPNIFASYAILPIFVKHACRRATLAPRPSRDRGGTGPVAADPWCKRVRVPARATARPLNRLRLRAFRPGDHRLLRPRGPGSDSSTPRRGGEGREVIVGYGTEADALRAAGAAQAAGIVAGTDVNNLSTGVTAREIDPNLFVVLRRNQAGNRQFLDAFKADFAMVSAEIAAQQCLSIIATPLLSRFLGTAGTQPERGPRRSSRGSRRSSVPSPPTPGASRPTPPRRPPCTTR